MLARELENQVANHTRLARKRSRIKRSMATLFAHRIHVTEWDLQMGIDPSTTSLEERRRTTRADKEQTVVVREEKEM
jgi:hypothetical protein